MKYIPVIIALLAGFILGSGWQNSELRIAQKKIASLNEELSKKSRGSLVPNVANMLGAASRAGRMKSHSEVKPSGEPPKSQPQHDSKLETPEPTVIEDDWPEDMPFDQEEFEDPQAALDAAKELWNIRKVQAREALAEKLMLTDTDLLYFDETVDKLNSKLRERFQILADSVEEKNYVDQVDGLSLVHDITGFMMDTYEDLGDVFPDGWQEETTDDLMLVNFIDPSVAEPMLKLEGLMDEEPL